MNLEDSPSLFLAAEASVASRLLRAAAVAVDEARLAPPLLELLELRLRSPMPAAAVKDHGVLYINGVNFLFGGQTRLLLSLFWRYTPLIPPAVGGNCPGLASSEVEDGPPIVCAAMVRYV